jgi:DNA-binding MarR family transcriptional regulator
MFLGDHQKVAAVQGEAMSPVNASSESSTTKKISAEQSSRGNGVAPRRYRRPDLDLDLAAVGVFGRIMQLSLVLGTAAERWCATRPPDGEFDVLTTLHRSGPPYVRTPSQLADSLMMSRAGMTKRLDRLEAAGLVERRLDPADRRSFRVALSAKGREVIDAALTEHAANLARLTARLGAQESAELQRSPLTLLRAVQQEVSSLGDG